MGIFKEKRIPTLLQNVDAVLEKSKGIKSVFVKMKDDLEAVNVDLAFKSEMVDDAMDELARSKVSLNNETKSNEAVIKNIDKIIG